MKAENIKILLKKNNSNKFLLAEKGEFKENVFLLKNVKFYNFINEDFKNLKNFNLIINFNKENIVNSISKYKLVPFYKYINHSKTLSKFNLYSPEIGLFYISETLKPIFIVMLSFVMIGFTVSFKEMKIFLKFYL